MGGPCGRVRDVSAGPERGQSVRSRTAVRLSFTASMYTHMGMRDPVSPPTPVLDQERSRPISDEVIPLDVMLCLVYMRCRCGRWLLDCLECVLDKRDCLVGIDELLLAWGLLESIPRPEGRMGVTVGCDQRNVKRPVPRPRSLGNEGRGVDDHRNVVSQRGRERCHQRIRLPLVRASRKPALDPNLPPTTTTSSSCHRPCR